MEKCKNCQWHRTNLTKVYDVLLDLTISGDFEDLLPDFENALCAANGCDEPEQKYYEKHGAALAKRERLKLRHRMGLAAFTRSYPEWAKELATQDKAMYEARQ